MTDFDQRWLTVWCGAVALFGLILFTAGWATTDPIARMPFALLGNPLPAEPDRYLRFTTSLMGAVTFGWASALYAAFRAAWALPSGTGPVWRTITGGIAVWYLIDSVASIANGFALNAVSNTVFVALYLVPLLRSGVLRG